MEHGDVDAVLLLFDSVAAERLWIATGGRIGEIFSLSKGKGMFVAEQLGAIVGVITEYRHDPYGHTIGMLVEENNRGGGGGCTARG